MLLLGDEGAELRDRCSVELDSKAGAQAVHGAGSEVSAGIQAGKHTCVHGMVLVQKE